MKLNGNYANLRENYLFAEVNKKVSSFKEKNPEKKIIRLGIGDVTQPLPQVVVGAMSDAARELGKKDTFKGYCDFGYDFLKDAILEYYIKKGVSIEKDELFISDGAKSDTGNIAEIFDKDNIVIIPDPVYPVYFDSNVMSGREIVFVEGNEENEFLPLPNSNVHADIIYICSPNNPTGAVYTHKQLKIWVDYALENNAVIIYDAAYEAFVRDKNLPTSIYQIKNADKCAIEMCSFSKTAGFTGVRCGYCVVPRGIVSDGVSVNKMWLRRQSTKFNGVSYVTQRGAAAALSKEGFEQAKQNIDYYLENAQIIQNSLRKLNIRFFGGQNSPYIWLKCPNNMDSWQFFDHLLENVNVVGTPGAGFGAKGEGFFRLTAFGKKEDVAEAMERIEKLL